MATTTETSRTTHLLELMTNGDNLAQGDSDWVTDDVPSILERPARTFEQFVTDHAAAFS
jgi:hypothetical protein